MQPRGPPKNFLISHNAAKPAHPVGRAAGPPKPSGAPPPTKAREARGLTTNPDPAATQAQHTPARKRAPHARGPEDTPRPSRKPVQSQPDPGQAAPTAATRTPPAAGRQGTTRATSMSSKDLHSTTK